MEPWIKFSPFYPHGGIPVPFAPGYFSETVEGIWQGLKVFEKADGDNLCFDSLPLFDSKQHLGKRPGFNQKFIGKNR